MNQELAYEQGNENVSMHKTEEYDIRMRQALTEISELKLKNKSLENALNEKNHEVQELRKVISLLEEHYKEGILENKG